MHTHNPRSITPKYCHLNVQQHLHMNQTFVFIYISFISFFFFFFYFFQYALVIWKFHQYYQYKLFSCFLGLLVQQLHKKLQSISY